jgi:hypothetical protein
VPGTTIAISRCVEVPAATAFIRTEAHPSSRMSGWAVETGGGTSFGFRCRSLTACRNGTDPIPSP